jgi:hypothetical protein
MAHMPHGTQVIIENNGKMSLKCLACLLALVKALISVRTI